MRCLTAEDFDCTFGKLPDHLLIEIFVRIPISEWARVSCVKKQWAALFRGECLWKTALVRKWPMAENGKRWPGPIRQGLSEREEMLIDIAKVFNMVSSLSQKKHSVKLIKNGVEVFKEYYPPSREVTLLDCSWEGDKFVLLERASISNTEEHRMDVEAAFLKASDVKYEKVKISDEDANDCNEEEHTYGGDFARSPPAIGTSSSDAKTLGDRSQSQATKMTAFIPVNVTSETMQRMPKKMKLDDSLISNPVGIKENENSFFDLLTSGIVKSSLFD